MLGEREDSTPWTFMSDRHKGLFDAVAGIFPNANHRFCARHIYQKLKKKHPGILIRNLFLKASKAYDHVTFKQAMEEIKNLDNEAWKYLSGIVPAQWRRHAYHPQARIDHVTNIMTESFNSWLNEVRGRTILTLIDYVRNKMMVRYAKRHEKTLGWTGISVW